MNSSPEERVTATVLLLAWYLNPNCQWLQCLTSPCDACTPCFSLHLMLDQLGQHLRPWWQEWEVTGLPGCQSGGSSTNPGVNFLCCSCAPGNLVRKSWGPRRCPCGTEGFLRYSSGGCKLFTLVSRRFKHKPKESSLGEFKGHFNSVGLL